MTHPGVLALRRGEEITGQEGAVELELREPFGRVMLAVLAWPWR